MDEGAKCIELPVCLKGVESGLGDGDIEAVDEGGVLIGLEVEVSGALESEDFFFGLEREGGGVVSRWGGFASEQQAEREQKEKRRSNG